MNNIQADGAASKNLILFTAADIDRTISRIAHEIIERHELTSKFHVEKNLTQLQIYGIPTRGIYLAQRIGRKIFEFTKHNVSVGVLDITLYRDDLHKNPAKNIQRMEIISGGVKNKNIILVDDVLFSGRTTKAALDALMDLGRPESVELAVLIDRGHRQLPIRADYVGKNIPTARSEIVAVRLGEIDQIDEITLTKESY